MKPAAPPVARPLTKLGALVTADPSAAQKRILDALEATGGNLTHAAMAIGVNYRVALRAVARLGLAEELERRWPNRRRGGAPT